jgi:hypothetical protein
MKKLVKEIEGLLIMYKALRDSDELLNSEYFDSMSYDIDGYEEAVFEAEDSNDIDELEDIKKNLKNQVEAFTKMVIAMKQVKFIYG